MEGAKFAEKRTTNEKIQLRNNSNKDALKMFKGPSRNKSVV